MNTKTSLNKNESRKRSWFIVINEAAYTDEICYSNMENYIESNFNPYYYCYNEELGDTGNKHIHLYLELANGVTFTSIKKKFAGAHIELRKGAPVQSRDYVFKPEGMKWSGKEKSHTIIQSAQEQGDFERFKNMRGYKTKERKMSANEVVEYMLDNFYSLEDMATYNPTIFNQMQRTIEKMFYNRKYKQFLSDNAVAVTGDNGQEMYEVDRKVYYLYGQSGSGKTYGIKKKYGDANVSMLTNLKSNMYYDDYRHTDVMIMDEFYGQLTVQEMLNLLDRYVSDLPCRYNNRRNIASKIILTSNLPFDELYKEVKNDAPIKYKAFHRRVNCGAWEMYQSQDEQRFICCHTDLSKIEKRLHSLYDLSEPPISTNGVKVVTPQELYYIKIVDASEKDITPESIEQAKEEYRKLPF